MRLERHGQIREDMLMDEDYEQIREVVQEMERDMDSIREDMRWRCCT